jgi:predicted ATPase
MILTIICQCRGEGNRVVELAEKLVASASEQGLSWYAANAMVLHGWALASRGEAAIGIEKMRMGLDQMHAAGAGLRRSYLLWLLAEALMRAGDGRQSSRTLSEALRFVSERGEIWWKAELHRLQGRCGSGGALPPRKSRPAFATRSR